MSSVVSPKITDGLITDGPLPKITEWHSTRRYRNDLERNDLEAFAQLLSRKAQIREEITRSNCLTSLWDAICLQLDQG